MNPLGPQLAGSSPRLFRLVGPSSSPGSGYYGGLVMVVSEFDQLGVAHD